MISNYAERHGVILPPSGLVQTGFPSVGITVATRNHSAKVYSLPAGETGLSGFLGVCYELAAPQAEPACGPLQPQASCSVTF